MTSLRDVSTADLRITGGGYLFRAGIWDVLRPGEDLLDAPLADLANAGRLAAYTYDGFWVSLDTLKDLEVLQQLEAQDAAPWEVWRQAPAPASAR